MDLKTTKCIFYRRRLFIRELTVNERFQQSEAEFDEKFRAMVEKRTAAETRLREMAAKTPKELAFYLDALEKEEQIDADRGDLLRDLVLEDENETAALKIQAAVRRWLIRKRERRPAVWSRNLLRTTMTEARARSYQDQIQLWQQRNKVAPMSHAELQELYNRSQAAYAKFSNGLNKSRLGDHKALTSLAQTEAVLAVLESAPSLEEYSPSQWSQFHSLPLHLATKARMEHKAAMRKMDMERWRRLLEDYG